MCLKFLFDRIILKELYKLEDINNNFRSIIFCSCSVAGFVVTAVLVHLVQACLLAGMHIILFVIPAISREIRVFHVLCVIEHIDHMLIEKWCNALCAESK